METILGLGDVLLQMCYYGFLVLAAAVGTLVAMVVLCLPVVAYYTLTYSSFRTPAGHIVAWVGLLLWWGFLSAPNLNL